MVCGLALRCSISCPVKYACTKVQKFVLVFISSGLLPPAASAKWRVATVLAWRRDTSKCHSHGRGPDTWPVQADARRHRRRSDTSSKASGWQNDVSGREAGCHGQRQDYATRSDVR